MQITRVKDTVQNHRKTGFQSHSTLASPLWFQTVGRCSLLFPFSSRGHSEDCHTNEWENIRNYTEEIYNLLPRWGRELHCDVLIQLTARLSLLKQAIADTWRTNLSTSNFGKYISFSVAEILLWRIIKYATYGLKQPGNRLKIQKIERKLFQTGVLWLWKLSYKCFWEPAFITCNK